MSNDMGSHEDSLARYRALRVAKPHFFHEPANSPVAILTDDRDIAAAQAEESARRKRNDQLSPDVRVGVLAADPYLGMLTRDAVRFADRSLGIYNRHVGEAGCVILPGIDDRIVLIRESSVMPPATGLGNSPAVAYRQEKTQTSRRCMSWRKRSAPQERACRPWARYIPTRRSRAHASISTWRRSKILADLQIAEGISHRHGIAGAAARNG